VTIVFLRLSALSAAAGIDATKNGFALVPRRAREVAVLAPPTDEAHATVLALLADGEAWSTSALALAFGELTADSKVQAVGRGRARLLLPAALPGG